MGSCSSCLYAWIGKYVKNGLGVIFGYSLCMKIIGAWRRRSDAFSECCFRWFYDGGGQQQGEWWEKNGIMGDNIDMKKRAMSMYGVWQIPPLIVPKSLLSPSSLLTTITFCAASWAPTQSTWHMLHVDTHTMLGIETFTLDYWPPAQRIKQWRYGTQNRISSCKWPWLDINDGCGIVRFPPIQLMLSLVMIPAYKSYIFERHTDPYYDPSCSIFGSRSTAMGTRTRWDDSTIQWTPQSCCLCGSQWPVGRLCIVLLRYALIFHFFSLPFVSSPTHLF